MPNESAKAIQVRFTPEFKRNLRALAKKYRHIRSDIQPTIEQIQAGNFVGDQVPRTGYTIFKVRIGNSDIRKGKRGLATVLFTILRRQQRLFWSRFTQS